MNFSVSISNALAYDVEPERFRGTNMQKQGALNVCIEMKNREEHDKEGQK